MVTPQWNDWTTAAKCAGTKDFLFAEGPDQRKVRIVCGDCPVRRQCLAEALDGRVEWGVWGGLTERERRALLKKRPDVTSWHALLLKAEVAS
jgi:WhiB family redox-sensing transcriptional regulator